MVSRRIARIYHNDETKNKITDTVDTTIIVLTTRRSHCRRFSVIK